MLLGIQVSLLLMLRNGALKDPMRFQRDPEDRLVKIPTICLYSRFANTTL